MSQAQDLFDRLTRLGVKLKVDGENLLVDSPQGALSPELRQRLVELKPQLIGLLQTPRVDIPRAPEHAVIPLTSGQRRLWNLMKLMDDQGIYNVPMVYELGGKLDIEALERSLEGIHRRHGVLRSRIVLENGEPKQEVDDAVAFALEFRDLSSSGESDARAEADRNCELEIRMPFDLAQAPLWRCTLLQLTGEAFVLIIVVHHIVFDLWSKTVFLRDLERLYQRTTLPPLDLEYRDFAYWEQGEDWRRRTENHLAYWKDQYVGGVAELLLPTDHARPASSSMEGRSRPFSVPQEVATRLQSLSREARCSLFMTLLAGFHVLLNRYTGQIDQVVCVPAACRNSRFLEPLVGYFNNLLPIRADLSGDPTFLELLRRVRGSSMEAMKHSDAPFQKIAELPDLALTPMTRGMFNFRGRDSTAMNLPGLKVSQKVLRRVQADFDLALYMGLEENTLGGVIDYSADLFDDKSIRGLLANLETVLDSVSRNPDLRLSELPSFRPRFSELEDRLRSHPKIDDAAVIVRSDSGNSPKVAYVVLNEHDLPSRQELEAVLHSHQAVEKVLLVPLDEIPRTVHGAIDLSALPSPRIARSRPGHEYVAPRNELENQLVDIWQRVLWRSDAIGINDNFFDLGGHSLLSVQLVSEMENCLGRSVPLTRLGQLGTIAELAEQLERPEKISPAVDSRGLSPDILHQLKSYTSAWQGARAAPDALITGLNVGGSRCAVFWVVQRYLNLSQLAKYLGPDQPIYGLRSGHNVMGYGQKDIAALAEYYVEEILQIQSTGPFIVGGICQASEIAFEIADRLVCLGHEMDLLCLQERFVPRPYSGRVAFFFGESSDRSPYYHYAQPELGWRKYYSGHIDVHMIQGEHGTYFQAENIESLTREMDMAFERARGARGQPHALSPAMMQLDRAAYRASLHLSQPTEVEDGNLRLRIQVSNRSTEHWLASERSGVYLGARWVNPRSRDPRGFDRFVDESLARAPLPVDLAPGESVQLELCVTIPESPEFRTVEIDLVDEGITWFADAGSESFRFSIE